MTNLYGSARGPPGVCKTFFIVRPFLKTGNEPVPLWVKGA